MIEIKHRSGRVLFAAENGQDVRAAVVEARERGANLRGADLWDADLRGADWQGLQLSGLPSGGVLLVPQGGGEWKLTVGCWSGTVDDLEELIGSDDWPKAKGHEQVLRRPGLEALVALCRAHIGSVEAREKEPVQ